MGLFDELRIDREPQKSETVLAEFRKRSWRRLWTFVFVVVVFGGAAVVDNYAPHVLQPFWVRGVFIVVMIGWFRFHVANWRCPNCDVFFGKRRIAGRCPDCGVVLEE